MNQTDLSEHAPVFEIKGSMITLTTLELINHHLELLEQQLAEKIAQAPEFFQQSPLVLAIDKRQDLSSPVDLPAILEIFKKNQLHLMALRADHEDDILAAQAINLPVLPPSIGKEPPAVKKAEPEPAAQAQPAKIIDQPVRSGQQIYAKGSDLIVLSTVSAGAELLADGHIHVYGPMRGRALAGINGNEEARIFCQQLSAELVSIAGHYKIAEDLRRIPTWDSATQIFLQNQQMVIQAM